MPARGTPGFDKLFKVRPFLESIRANFLSQYVPHKEVAIDEAMIKFKGRSSLKQYMPMKPIKRGIKMWCRADSINGYLNDFEIYAGKSGEGVTHDLGYLLSQSCALCYMGSGMKFTLTTSLHWNFCRLCFAIKHFHVEL